MDGIVSSIAAWIVGIISATGYLGILGLMAIESACVPLPSEVVMPFAGYLASTGRLNLILAATAGAAGCNLGSAVAYEMGRRGGRPFVSRYGRYLLLTVADMDRTERFFERHGSIAVLIGRVLPEIRSFIAFPAGIARMPLLRFHVFTFAGSWPWCFGLAYIGKLLGQRWRSDSRVAALFHKLDAVLLVVAVLAITWFVLRRVRSLRTERR